MLIGHFRLKDLKKYIYQKFLIFCSKKKLINVKRTLEKKMAVMHNIEKLYNSFGLVET